MTAKTVERRAQTRWLFIILSFFAAQAVLWVTAVTLVGGDPSHAVVSDYDRDALDWDAKRAAAQQAAALGWHTDVTLHPETQGSAGLTVAIEDAQGVALTEANVTVEAFHCATASIRHTMVLKPTGDAYIGRLSQARPGKWRFILRIEHGTDVLEKTVTKTLVGGESA